MPPKTSNQTGQTQPKPKPKQSPTGLTVALTASRVFLHHWWNGLQWARSTVLPAVLPQHDLIWSAASTLIAASTHSRSPGSPTRCR